MHVGFFFAEWIIFLLFFVLFLSLRNSQPFKSREPIPWIALIAQYCFTMSTVTHYLYDYQWRSSYQCWVDVFLLWNWQSMTVMLMPLNYLRYIVIINLNKEKSHIIKGTTGTKMDWITKFITYLSFITRVEFTFIYVGIFFFFSTIFNISIIGSTGFVCESQMETVIELVYSIVNLVAIIFTNLLIILDLLNNAIRYCLRKKKQVKESKGFCHFLYKYFISGDPFRYRTETFIGILYVCYYISYVIYTSTQQGKYGAMYVIGVLKAIDTYFLFVYLALYITIVTLVFNLRYYCSKRVKPEKFKEVLENPELYAMFYKHCDSEFSLELLLFLETTKKFQTLKSTQKLIEAKEIQTKYLDNGAPLQINVPQSLIIKFKGQMERGEFPSNMFEELDDEVTVALMDPLSRFYLTSEYKAYASSQKFVEQQLGYTQVSTQEK